MRTQVQHTHVAIVVIDLGVLKQKRRDQSRNVGRVAGHEYDAKAAPNVDQKFVRPRFGRFEVDQSAAQQTPHRPQCRRHAETTNRVRSGQVTGKQTSGNKCLPEIFGPLSARGIQPERAKPLVQSHGHGGDVKRHEYSDPKAGAQRQQERQQWNVCFSFRGDHHRHAAIEIRRGKVDPL